MAGTVVRDLEGRGEQIGGHWRLEAGLIKFKTHVFCSQEKELFVILLTR